VLPTDVMLLFTQSPPLLLLSFLTFPAGCG
jgi:hypothetical protein